MANGEMKQWLIDNPCLDADVPLENEFIRLGFDSVHWRISDVNNEFK